MLHGLYWLMANLAAERPAMLLVDDAQWVDEPSLRFLAYLGRRVRELPVAVVIAARPALPGEDRAVLEAIAADADALAPAPLTAAAIGVLAERRFGVEPDTAFVEACLRATGGNALLVEEVLAELDSPDASAVEAAGVERVGGASRGGWRRSVRARVRWPRRSPCSATAASCRWRPCSPNWTSKPRGTRPRSSAAADLLGPTGALRFRHPLIRAAIIELQPAVELGAAHSRAARLLADRGAAPGAIAAHLLAAPPVADPWVPEALREAARSARGQGAPELAAAYLRRALLEPPADRVPILLELGRAEHAAGAAEATIAAGSRRGARRARPRSRSS